MAELVHEHGALAGVELGTAAAWSATSKSRLPARSVSQMTDESLYCVGAAIELDKEGIREIQGFYVDAAQRALRAGFDIVNVHGAECGAPAAALPDGAVQPAHRRVRRLVRQPGPLLARDARARARGGRRARPRSPPALRRHAARQPARDPRRRGGPTGSSSSPTTSSTSGTCRSAAGSRPSGRGRGAVALLRARTPGASR